MSDMSISKHPPKNQPHIITPNEITLNVMSPNVMSLNVITLNVNGLRSSLQKGLLPWLEGMAPDVVLLQEVRAEPSPEVFAEIGYHSFFMPAQKKGYSGVAILSKQGPQRVHYGIGIEEFDLEGRVIRLEFADFQVISVYAPSGTSSSERIVYKSAFQDAFYEYVQKLLEPSKQRKPLILAGDFNIAHQHIDLKNWKSNIKNSGFLPEERAWMTKFLELGLLDAQRHLLGDQAEYTWWSQRGQAFNNNVGWRIDYQCCSSEWQPVSHCVWREPRFSDHAPLGVVYRRL
jgi:exodeoxyribonuclease III